jgi:hypothetical protein
VELLTGLLLVFDLGLAVVEEEELEPIFRPVSFMRHMFVVPLIVAKSAVRLVLDECANLAVPGGRCDTVGLAHIFVVGRCGAALSSLLHSSRHSRGLYICGVAFCGRGSRVAGARLGRVARLRDEVNRVVVNSSHGESNPHTLQEYLLGCA